MWNYSKILIMSVVLFAAGLVLGPEARAQRLALKTNALEWVALSPNMAVEARVSRRVSLQLAVSGCPFDFAVAGYNWKNYRIDPEVRYWFNRPMARHFMALSFTAAGYRLRHNDHHLNGDVVAAGISYGYALVLSDHWNMEAEIGAGIGHFSAYDYRGSHGQSGLTSKNYKKFLPVPIRVGISFSYIFK